MSSVLSSAYSGAASIGEAKATISVVVGAIIVLGLSVSASFSIMSKPTRTGEVQAEVIDSTCTETVFETSDGKKNTSQNCLSNVNYTINDQMYTSKVNTSPHNFKKGDKILVKYNPSNPIDISYGETSLSTVGWILCGVAVCIAVVVAIYYYAVTRFKPLAAYEGASTSIDLAQGLAGKIF